MPGSFSPKRRLYQLGKTLYRAIPLRIRASLHPIAANVVLLRRLRPEVWIISGEERNSHLPLSICYYSITDEQRCHLRDRIFGESSQARFVGRAWLWNAFTFPPEAAQGCSMTVAEVHEKHLRLMGPNGGLVIPTWIRGYARLPRGPEVMKRYSIKNALRKIRQHSLEYEATCDPKAFDFFFDRMYLPYARNRYGEGAFIGSREELRGLFDSGELILVKKQNEYIAGQIVVYQGDEASMPTLGVLDGRWELVAEGALAATYEFTLMHLEQRGCNRVSFCQSRSFLDDGVLLFKKKYQTISSSSSYKYVTKVLADTSATRAFLQNNPFIFQHEGKLRAAVFVSAELLPPPPLDEIHKNHSYAGLKETIAFFLSPQETTGPDQSPREQLPILATDKSTPAQNQPQYQTLTKKEYAPLISRLGPIRIANAIAIQPPQQD